MTDRELLELAAKAAGLFYHGSRVGLDYENCYVSTTNNSDDWFVWNPLVDDGDAFRLYVRLNLKVSAVPYRAKVTYGVSSEVIEPVDDDPYAATRRAIVRAAAEVGKGTLLHDEFVKMFPDRFDEDPA